MRAMRLSYYQANQPDRAPTTAMIDATRLPEALYTAIQVREFDRLAIERHGIAAATLMERAGAAAFTLLRARGPRARRVGVICGTGNNGGDGYVVARLAKSAGLTVFVLTVGDPARRKGDALAMHDAAAAAGVPIQPFADVLPAQADVIVDALFGTGLERPVEEPWRDAIEAIGRSGVPVLAVDIPSGLHADTGAVMGAAVRAEATMSFIGLKAGLFTGAGREHAGEIFFDDLAIPPAVYESQSPLARRLDAASLRGLLPRRERHAHKGSAGRVLIVGGNVGMPGAVRLAGEAAYRAGAGLVTVATHPAHAAFVNTVRPELTARAVSTGHDLHPLLAQADIVAVGPGLGQDSWARALLAVVLESPVPLVIDADALNLLAEDPARRTDWILTPHPGEAGRLLGVPAAEIQGDRFRAALAIVASFDGTCVLKGSGTVVASAHHNPMALCDAGNPGMASGGMGDVLTGVIAALRAQGLSAHDAACLGVWLHARAGDQAARDGEIGLIATDIMAPLRRLIAQLGA
jgi:hydroxyethylthiazole kinase-like uncharacterized protein yjeF